MNVVFISPNFPLYYYNFCKNLKIRGVNVLGIGDAPYESLPQHMIDSVTEYYKVGSLENFYEVEEACRFFNQKYGILDWIESQNEYWLETEATLRKIFDVNSGTKIDDMAPMKYKSKMKDVYKIYHMGDTEVHALDGISLTINKGEFVAIVGQSGSGKT